MTFRAGRGKCLLVNDLKVESIDSLDELAMTSDTPILSHLPRLVDH